MKKNTKAKTGDKIPVLKIVVTIFVLLLLYLYCQITYEDTLYMQGHFEPRDYLGPVYNFMYIVFIRAGGVFLIFVSLAWLKLKPIFRLLIAVGIVGLLMVANVIDRNFNNVLELNEIGGWQEEVDLVAYEPFRENTLAVSLPEEATLKFTTDLPRLDGATALYPLYAAFARATYPPDDYRVYRSNTPGIVSCNRTAEAFDNLLAGDADMVFLMGISPEQQQQADQAGIKLKITPIGKEAFVFFVNKSNPVRNLSTADIKAIYSGEITNWQQLGGRKQKILVYQRPEVSGSQVMLKEIMGDVPILPGPKNNYFDEMLSMYRAVAYKNHRNALGYSFLYYIRNMIAEDKIAFLAIDGYLPTAANISSDSYPFSHCFYAVTIDYYQAPDDQKDRINNTEQLLNWLLGDQGQYLVAETGYVPLP